MAARGSRPAALRLLLLVPLAAGLGGLAGAGRDARAGEPGCGAGAASGRAAGRGSRGEAPLRCPDVRGRWRIGHPGSGGAGMRPTAPFLRPETTAGSGAVEPLLVSPSGAAAPGIRGSSCRARRLASAEQQRRRGAWHRGEPHGEPRQTRDGCGGQRGARARSWRLRPSQPARRPFPQRFSGSGRVRQRGFVVGAGAEQRGQRSALGTAAGVAGPVPRRPCELLDGGDRARSPAGPRGLECRSVRGCDGVVVSSPGR